MNKKDYSHLGNEKIVVMALFRLLDNDKAKKNKYHTEHITIEARRLCEEKFSWILYPEYPDMEPARRALFNARNDGWVTGATARSTNKDGWSLTEKGIRIADEEFKKFGNTIKLKQSQNVTNKFASILSKQSFIQINKKLNETEEFLNSDFSIYELADILSISMSDVTIFNSHFYKLKLEASIHNKRIEKFLSLCEKKFEKFINPKNLLVDMKARDKSLKKNKEILSKKE